MNNNLYGTGRPPAAGVARNTAPSAPYAALVFPARATSATGTPDTFATGTVCALALAPSGVLASAHPRWRRFPMVRGIASGTFLLLDLWWRALAYLGGLASVPPDALRTKRVSSVVDAACLGQ